jgi:hypothetical protein
MAPRPPNKRVAASYEVFVRFSMRLEDILHLISANPVSIAIRHLRPVASP